MQYIMNNSTTLLIPSLLVFDSQYLRAMFWGEQEMSYQFFALKGASSENSDLGVEVFLKYILCVQPVSGALRGMALEVLLWVLIAGPNPDLVVIFQRSWEKNSLFWNIVFKWMASNLFIFLAQTVAGSVRRSHSSSYSFLLYYRCFYQAIFSFFFSSEERQGEEGECEALWHSLVCWMCLAEVKSCDVFPCWAIFGTLVLTQDHRHYKEKGHDSLSRAAFAISISFDVTDKPSSLYLSILVLEICHGDIKIVTRFSFFSSWTEMFISVFRR